MPRPEINRIAEMEVFAKAVELGGFSAAARRFDMTPSAVSKLVARLEARLGARLLLRSTRRLQPTPEGQEFYDRAVRILADLEDAERQASVGACPRGHLRVNSNLVFGRRYILPLVPHFLALYPEVTLDLVLSDTAVDLMEERADIAIRVGPLQNPSLIARKLGSSRSIVVAAPAYLAKRGTPATPAELERHNRIGWTFSRSVRGWPFRVEDQTVLIPPTGNVRVSDGDTARQLALDGVGIVRLAQFHIGPDIAAGRLIPLLEDFNPGDGEDIHAVYLGRSDLLPARARAFIDFLVESAREWIGVNSAGS